LIGDPNKNNGKYFYLIVKNTLVKLEHPTSDVYKHSFGDMERELLRKPNTSI
jgi:hypothetical protein